MFEPRDEQSYDEDITFIESSSRTKTINGIKTRSTFNKLDYFHVVNGHPCDVMHDILQGAAQTNLQLLIKELDSENLVTINDICVAFETLKYGRNDKENEVPTQLLKQDFNFKMTAAKMWTLLRLLPILIGEKCKLNKQYVNFTKLVKILRLALKQEFSEQNIQYLEDFISEYLEEFNDLYKDKDITAKQHFLVHYGRIIRTFGPLRSLWAMRFESKHSYFKQVVNSMKNFKNITYSLSQSHQYLQVHYLLQPEFIDQNSMGTEVKPNLDEIALIKAKIKNTESIEFFKWFETLA
jgi:hypothetical protein